MEKTYTTTKEWKCDLVDDSSFSRNDPNMRNGGQFNPKQSAVHNNETANSKVKLGECVLNTNQIDRLNDYTTYEPTPEESQQIIESSAESFL